MDFKQKISSDVLEFMESRAFGRLSIIVQHNLGDNLPRIMQSLRISRAFPFISSFSAELTRDEIAYLARQPEVVFISSDRPFHTCLNVARPAVGVDFAQDLGLSGQGVGIAVIDSGMYSHPDVQGAIDAFVDFNDGLSTPYDLLGHGTHVAGIIVGRGRVNANYRGIAPASRLLALKVFDQNNFTTLGLILQAMVWVLENHRRYNIRVVNLSLGGQPMESFDQDPICRATRALWEEGIVVVASAGNEGRQGQNTIVTPGTCPYAITIGAMDDRRTIPRTDDTLAPFSSQGPTPDGLVKPDVVAPGVNIISLRAPGSALDRQLPQNRVGTDYFILSGTSMAAPVVAGLAALVLSRRPDLSPDSVKAAILSTSQDRGAPANRQGHGYVNAQTLIRYLPEISSSWQGRQLNVKFVN